ncbi:MAG: histidine kinase [Clostridiales bacterium]|nr:histidine kinase [Clostridiales bacterium]
MTGETATILLMLLPLAAVQVGLLFAVLIDPYISRRHRNVFLTVIVLIFSLVAQNLIDFLLDKNGALPFARTIAGIYGYSVRPLILVLLFRLVTPDRDRSAFLWALVGVNFAVHLTALFSPICFSITADNVFHRGPLGYCCHIVSGVLLMQLLYSSLRRYSREKKAAALIPVVNVLLIIASVAADTVLIHSQTPVTFLTAAIVTTSLFYYIWLHLQFAREHEDALRAQQRIGIMMTQIQPHFLYNTIATFKALCRKDPEAAAEVADKFGLYLRQNLDSLGQTGLIPFSKELEHTRLYADIEMIRFENVRVEYDIGDEGFSVPPLTLQPMVENAIRHGVRIREDGRVLVRTAKLNGMHEITVRDNGAGFDAASLDETDGGHIGIKSVRERIESMCGGSFRIESVMGEGTVVTILIPEKEDGR